MSPQIQILDAQAANQIAAGEVVERPVSVVKELVENSLDAGARQIEITIEGNGVSLIRIRDDGNGILPEDLPQAVLRHATSKIRQIEDLNELTTLGFRGEALPSIASVSRLDITTRPPHSVSGWSLKLIGGEQNELTEMGCPIGTTVTVEDLFFNTPARRKFLKSSNTEFGLISDTLGRLALARPEVSFTLRHPKQIVFQTPGRGKLLESIGAIYGNALARQLIPISATLADWHLEGYISPPDLVRSSRQAETLIVNGRIIRSNLISRAISEGYHTLIPNRLYPIAILHLTLPPSEYDVNVHPTKMEIRFQKEKELAQFVSSHVRDTLLKSRPLTSFDRSEALKAPLSKLTTLTSWAATNPTETPSSASQSLNYYSISNSFETDTPKIANRPTQSKLFFPSLTRPDLFTVETPSASFNLHDSSNSLNPTDLRAEPQKNEDTFSVSESPLKEVNVNASLTFHEAGLSLQSDKSFTRIETEERNSLLALRPLGQVFGTYILTTDGESLVIIDQHAAHERINYERLLENHRQKPGVSQALLLPTPMDFTPIEEQALLENLMALNDMGFVLEHFGGRTYLLRGVPAYSGSYSGEELLRQFLEKVIQRQTAPTFDELLEEWIYLLACKESIKAKESLSLLEMQQLIVRLSQTENPYTCPHGRPTMTRMTRSDLEKRFYRT